MGTKGAKQSSEAAGVAADFVERIGPLGDVTSKKMFGGHGIFESGKMFAIVDSAGDLFLKAGEANQDRFEAAGAEKHGRMPYWSIPADVLDDDAALQEWTAAAIAASKG